MTLLDRVDDRRVDLLIGCLRYATELVTAVGGGGELRSPQVHSTTADPVAPPTPTYTTEKDPNPVGLTGHRTRGRCLSGETAEPEDKVVTPARRLRVLLEHDDGLTARSHVAGYYSPAKKANGRTGWTFSGSQFERLADHEHPNVFTSADVVALTMLSVSIPAHVTIWLLGDGRWSWRTCSRRSDPTSRSRPPPTK